MQVQDLRILFEYNYWARDRILAAAARLEDVQWTGPAPFGPDSLRGVLIHAYDTECSWRMRCQYGGGTVSTPEAAFPTPASLAERWGEEEALTYAYLDSLQDHDLIGLITYVNYMGMLRERVLWHCLFHLANHSAQHRAEAAALLTEYGQSPGDLDFLEFLNEMRV